MAHAGEALIRDLDVRKFDARAVFLRLERKRQYRVDSRCRAIRRAPSLHDQPLRLNMQNLTGKHTIECTKLPASPLLFPSACR